MLTWGDVIRLMCWAHTSWAMDRSEYLAAIRVEDKEVTQKILLDIYTLQWSVQNEATFRTVFRLLEEKHSYDDNPGLNIAVLRFFMYMRKVWVDSSEFRPVDTTMVEVGLMDIQSIKWLISFIPNSVMCNVLVCG